LLIFEIDQRGVINYSFDPKKSGKIVSALSNVSLITNPYRSKISSILGGGSIVTGIGIAAPWTAGFTTGGVVGGSVAAGVQAVIGNVAAGSGFAVIQSVAAKTVLGTAAAPAIGVAAVAGGAYLVLKK
jgi:hypothetical protein